MPSGFLRAFALLAPLGALGCQVLFGDFELVDPEPGKLTLGLACEPDEARCNGAILEVCADDRRGFSTLQSCASEAECNLNARACRPCFQGEHQCRGDTLERCEAGAWVLVQTCASAALCRLDSARLSGTCEAPLCTTAGAHACQGARLARCAPGRDRFDVVALCESAELCDATAADQAVTQGRRAGCAAPVCSPGDMRCTGAALEYCSPDLRGFSPLATCADAGSCSAARGVCDPCTAGDVECNGAELRRCAPDGSWQPLATCDAAGLCNAEAEHCDTPACDTPGDLRCAANLPVLEECGSDHAWHVRAACATSELCNAEAGRCLPAACTLNATRCQGNVHERCSADRTHFETLQSCGTGQNCDPVLGCVTLGCDDGTTRCNGAVFERCTGGRFVPQVICDSSALCHPQNGCTTPACGGYEPSFDCTPQGIVLQCLSDQSDWMEIRTCTTGTCDLEPALTTGLPECDECSAGTLSCDGLTLMRCSSDGQAEEAIAACPSACSASGTTADCR